MPLRISVLALIIFVYSLLILTNSQIVLFNIISINIEIGLSYIIFGSTLGGVYLTLHFLYISKKEKRKKEESKIKSE